MQPACSSLECPIEFKEQKTINKRPQVKFPGFGMLTPKVPVSAAVVG
jgi:hypothetical protein